ncbi:hypothetical protein DFP95_101620 [Cohnella lupini]|uniref:Uncharacterized protein n=1 Tax=Cohnella lupini TaxID=1294267 RepID=A0A3D9IWJ9_9BACL|nr:hypothetical protein DFP95_101620 [Cohnella lupini]
MRKVLRLFSYYKYKYKRPRFFIVFFSFFWIIIIGMTLVSSIYNKNVLIFLNGSILLIIYPFLIRLLVYIIAKSNGWK